MTNPKTKPTKGSHRSESPGWCKTGVAANPVSATYRGTRCTTLRSESFPDT